MTYLTDHGEESTAQSPRRCDMFRALREVVRAPMDGSSPGTIVLNRRVSGAWLRKYAAALIGCVMLLFSPEAISQPNQKPFNPSKLFGTLSAVHTAKGAAQGLLGLPPSLEADVKIKHEVSSKQFAAYVSYSPKVTITLFIGTIANAFPNGADYWDAVGGFFLPGGAGYAEGALTYIFLHEWLHVCMGPSKHTLPDEPDFQPQQEHDSWLHLAIDATVASNLCAAVLLEHGEAPLPGPPFCLDGLSDDSQAKIRAMCEALKRIQDKWNTEPGEWDEVGPGKEKAQKCLADWPDLDNLLVGGTGGQAAGCGVAYPELGNGVNEVIPMCDSCDLGCDDDQ